MKETIIKMTRKGLEEQKQSLIALKNVKVELEKMIALTRKNTMGVEYDENSGLKELERQYDINESSINYLERIIENVEIIEDLEMDDELVNIGDIINANFMFAPDDEEEMIIQLVGGTGNSCANQVSINSPVGKAIYGRKIGETVSYKASNNEVKVKLLRKTNNQNIQ